MRIVWHWRSFQTDQDDKIKIVQRYLDIWHFLEILKVILCTILKDIFAQSCEIFCGQSYKMLCAQFCKLFCAQSREIFWSIWPRGCSPPFLISSAVSACTHVYLPTYMYIHKEGIPSYIHVYIHIYLATYMYSQNGLISRGKCLKVLADHHKDQRGEDLSRIRKVSRGECNYHTYVYM